MSVVKKEHGRMGVYGGVLGTEANCAERIKRDIDEVARIVEAAKMLGQKIVLTSGTWDLVHTGHAEYLSRARERGTFLVVGVDSDAKVKKRKGKFRPIVGEDERMVMLAHLRYVNLVVLKHVDAPKWELLKAVRPHVLIVSHTREHKEDEIKGMKEYYGELHVLEAQSQKGTTARLRLMMIDGLEAFAKRLQDEIPRILQDTLSTVSGKKEGDST
mgnify:FL=1